MAVARIRSTRVTPEQAEGQREANRSGRRARASSTLDSRLGREPRPHKHELELVLRPSASAAGSQGSLLRVYGNHAQVYTQLVESVLTICWSSPNSQRLSVYTRRPNWLRPPTLIIPTPTHNHDVCGVSVGRHVRTEHTRRSPAQLAENQRTPHENRRFSRWVGSGGQLAVWR